MSLFKAREWWATIVGEDEEFDTGCMCVTNIDNQSNGNDKIVIGSFHGFLRIYNPRPIKNEDGTWSGFRPEDVMVEAHLNTPIIQIASGRFLSGSDKLHLAVLHPRKLAVYTVIGSTGSVEHGSHHQLKLAYEHNLQRTAFCFCYGEFGGAKGRDFMCIQSMDGTVSVYEQETFAFSRFLPGALLPGPIKYLPKTDSFITVSSSRQVESYKYQVLAVATDVKSKEESQNIKSGKRVAHDWVFNTGEQALDIYISQFNNSPLSIFVLGERNLYCLTESGKLRFQKKFDFNPSCFAPHFAAKDGLIQTIVGTHTSTLLIYQDITLKWAAQLMHVPIQVAVASFQDLEGVIVTLDEAGHLQCSYLGTEPALFSPPTAELREIDYESQDREMTELNKIIKMQQQKSTLPMPNTKSDDDVTLTTDLSHDLDQISQAGDTEVNDEDTVPSISIKIYLKAKMSVNNVRINVHVRDPLFVSESLISFHSIDSSRPGETQVCVYMKKAMSPADLTMDVTATYSTQSGAPRIIHNKVKLPLKLVIKPVLPIKAANFKITLDTNKQPVNLNDLFPDLLGENAGGQGNALGFQTYGGQTVTVLASKTSQRYRLQCDIFEGMFLVMDELIARLISHHKQRHVSDFRITYDGQLPLQEYFDVLDRHFEFRQRDEKFCKVMEERAVQFRAIQRRLLTRFKDKTPGPLSNLDTLLDGTYRQILSLADAAAENKRSQDSAAVDLSCATRMLNTLIRYWAGMSDSEYSVLEACISPNVGDNGEQGWEETVDASITHLLRTSLAKSAKDQTVNPQPLALLKDTTKLKKHIALLCDRLSKGAKLTVEGQTVNSLEGGHASQNDAPMPQRIKKKQPSAQMAAPQIAAGLTESDRPSDQPPPYSSTDVSEVPLGSKLGENKSVKKKGLPALNGAHGGELPPLDGRMGGMPGGRDDTPSYNGVHGTDDDDDHPFEKRRSYMKQKPPDVPDLDAMDSASTNGDTDGLVFRGNSDEVIMGL